MTKTEIYEFIAQLILEAASEKDKQLAQERGFGYHGVNPDLWRYTMWVSSEVWCVGAPSNPV